MGDEVELVRIGDKHYPHEAWLAAFNTAFMNAIERRIPDGSTIRGVVRQLRAVNKPAFHKKVMAEAIKLLEADADEVSPSSGVVVAAFPSF